MGSRRVKPARRIASSARVTRTASGHHFISIPSCDRGYGSSVSRNGSLAYNFIFHQLGTIEWHPPHTVNPDEDSHSWEPTGNPNEYSHDWAWEPNGNPHEDSHGWKPTGFVLAVGAGRNGQPTNSLYAILDLFPPADPNLDRDDRVDEPMSNWRREQACKDLADTSECFSCARLDGVKGLGDCDGDFGTRLEWTARIKGAIDLLGVELP